MSNFCKVGVNPTNGLRITPSEKNPEYGTVRLDSEQHVVTDGFVNLRKRSAFVRGKIEVLQSMFSSDRVQGKIIRKTSSAPFYDGQEPVANPDTGENALRNGQLYYQQFLFTQDLNAFDCEVEVKVEEKVEA